MISAAKKGALMGIGAASLGKKGAKKAIKAIMRRGAGHVVKSAVRAMSDDKTRKVIRREIDHLRARLDRIERKLTAEGKRVVAKTVGTPTRCRKRK